MSAFYIDEIAKIRWFRTLGFSMSKIMERMPHHTRDEIVEVIDATIRHQRNADAQRYVNRVLALQSQHVPLVNGRPSWKAAPIWKPMF